MAAGWVFGSERATEATASSHFSAGTPVHETTGDAGGPLLPGSVQAAITRNATTASHERGT
jgi:hypothetical protein